MWLYQLRFERRRNIFQQENILRRWPELARAAARARLAAKSRWWYHKARCYNFFMEDQLRQSTSSLNAASRSQPSLSSRIVFILSFIAAILLTIEAFVVVFSFVPGINLLFIIYGIALFSFANLFLNIPSFILGLLVLYFSKANGIITAAQERPYSIWSLRLGFYVLALSFILFFYGLWLVTGLKVSFAHMGGL